VSGRNIPRQPLRPAVSVVRKRQIEIEAAYKTVMHAFEAFLDRFPERTPREHAQARRFVVRGMAIAFKGAGQSSKYLNQRLQQHVKNLQKQRLHDVDDELIYRQVERACQQGAKELSPVGEHVRRSQVAAAARLRAARAALAPIAQRSLAPCLLSRHTHGMCKALIGKGGHLLSRTHVIAVSSWLLEISAYSSRTSWLPVVADFSSGSKRK
jgi:hypothetical protein